MFTKYILLTYLTKCFGVMSLFHSVDDKKALLYVYKIVDKTIVHLPFNRRLVLHANIGMKVVHFLFFSFLQKKNNNLF